MVQTPNHSNLTVLSAARAPLRAVAVFSLFSNLLLLTVPIYMLQLYDRVLGSRSYETLAMLTIAAVGLLMVQAGLEKVRSRLLVRIAAILETRWRDPILAEEMRASALGDRPRGMDGPRDLNAVRAFITGPGLLSIIDSPWVPIYVGFIFLLHPVLGWVAVGGALVLFVLALANDLSTRAPLKSAGEANQRLSEHVDGALRNAEAVRGLGMLPALLGRWRLDALDAMVPASLAADRMATVSALAKFARQGIQVAMLGVGVALVVDQQMTAGVMIAGSILLSRALAPVETAIGSWRSAVSARAALGRLNGILARIHDGSGAALALPDPAGELRIEDLRYAHPGSSTYFLRGISLGLRPGEALGIVGPSGCGKSTLLRLLAGVATPSAGTIRLDGAELDHWGEDLGRHIGYLPQSPQLFAGTIWENIGRMRSDPDSAAIIRAARRAQVHDLVLRFPNGYETDVGQAGSRLSGGQQRLIALARALYGDPKLLILDEPSANLDAEGEEMVRRTIADAKAAGMAVVVVSHQLAVLQGVDKMLVMRDGTVERLGPREEVMRALQESRMRGGSGDNVRRLPGHGPQPQAQQTGQGQ